jgi:hypothetical protein
MIHKKGMQLVVVVVVVVVVQKAVLLYNNAFLTKYIIGLLGNVAII